MAGGFIAGFMFGNINEEGELEEGIFDKETVTQLSNIEDHGIVPGGIEEEVMKERTNLEEDDDYDSVGGVPFGGVDYTEIDEAAEDEEEVAYRRLKEEEEEESRLKERYYQEGLKYTQRLAEDNPNDDYDDDYDNETSLNNAPLSMPSFEGNFEGPNTSSNPPFTGGEAEVDKEMHPEHVSTKQRQVEMETGTVSMETDKPPPTHPQAPPHSSQPVSDSLVDHSEEVTKEEVSKEGVSKEDLYAKVREHFPLFQPDSVLRFSSLLGLGRPSSLPKIWAGAVRPKKRKKKAILKEESEVTECNLKLNLGDTPPRELWASDDEDMLLSKGSFSDGRTHDHEARKKRSVNTSSWRYGPSKFWYDLMNVPEDGKMFNYGFKLKTSRDEDVKGEDEGNPPSDEDLPDDAFYMLSQQPWENDIIFEATTQSVSGSSWPHLPGMSSQGSTIARFPPGLSAQSDPSSKKEKYSDVVYSLFPPENKELIYGNWEQDIIFDPEAMDHIPKPKVVQLDPNDPNLIVGYPEEPDVLEPEPQRDGKKEKRKSQVLIGKLTKTEQKQCVTAQKKDMFNLSIDEYYNPKLSSETSLVDLEGTAIQHSIPSARLHPLWFPTHYSRHMLRNFHRPKLKGLSSPEESTGYFPVYSLTKHAKEMDNEREKERVGSGGGEVFFMRTLDDLTPCDSHLVLFEYSEEHPPLLSNIGMASKVKNYYRRPERQKEAPPFYAYGETSYVLSTSYFLGQLKPGQSLQSLENTMFRAPIYQHRLPSTDFLVIRSGEGLYIRDVTDVFSVGQECPKMEVPGPNSKQDKAFQKDFLTLTLYRLFAESRENPKQLRMDQVKASFPHLSENVIRKRLKLFANFERFGSDFSNYGCWLLRPDFRLPSEEEIRDLITPEQFCAHASMRSAEQRLKDAGYGGKSLFMEDEDDEDIAQKLDDEILAAPWNTTKHFINAMKGKYLLQINGPADPTGIGEGFSYIRTSNKTAVGKEEGPGTKQPKRSGTDADLRKLHLDKAKNVLRSFGVPEEEISRLSRWEVVDVVRTMSTEAVRSGGTAFGSFKFARGRLTHLSAQERYKEECQRVFDLQNKVLGSSELLSTDEESSDEESEDELTKNLEKFLIKKNTHQASHEEEELEREELKKLLAQDKKIETKSGLDTPGEQPSRSDTPTNEGDDSMSVASSGIVGRRLVITRTFSQDGMEYQRKEVVKNPAVIDAYLKIAQSKDKEQIRLAFAEQDIKAKEDMRKEKKRLQDQLRRIRRMEEKSMHKKPKKEKKIPDTTLKMKCGACGQLGHMKTNKNCPMFKKNPVQVAMTEAQEEAEREAILTRDDLVKVEGTKILFTNAFITHIEDTKKKSLLLKFPKDKLRKRRRQGEDDLEYLGKRRKTVQRRDTNPEVPFSAALERILMKLRALPESAAFQKPVSVKVVPDYYTIIRFPMDLQTIKENLRQHYYRSREMFLEHVNLIVTNCITYNGFGSELTKSAQRLLEVCTDELQKNEDDLARLECKINPALDENAYVAFGYILETIINRMKAIPESTYFHYPVSVKQLPDYHNVVKQPMDLETMRKNCKKHRYHKREQFSRDVDLIVENSTTYNGPESPFTKTTEMMREVTRNSLVEYQDTLEQLEAKIAEIDSRRADATTLDLMVFDSDKPALSPGGGVNEDVSLDLDFSSILQDLQTSPHQSGDSEDEEDEEGGLDEEGDINVDVISQDTLIDSKSPQSTVSQSVQIEDDSSSESELED